MKRFISATLAAAALAALGGCAAAKTDTAAAAPTAPKAVSDDVKRAALMKAGEGYTNALLAGDIAGVSGYLDASCTDEDRGSTALAVGMIAQTAKGATMKITGVHIAGDRGGVSTYELSTGTSDALRRLVKAGFESGRDRWIYTGGEWYFKGDCGSASPAPSPAV